jgi:hypothetical protein
VAKIKCVRRIDTERYPNTYVGVRVRVFEFLDLLHEDGKRREKVLIASHDQTVAGGDVRPVEVDDGTVDVGPKLGGAAEVALP